MDDKELIKHLDVIKEASLESKTTSANSYAILMGDNDHIGLLNRMLSLEEAQSELSISTAKTLDAIDITLKKFYVALLGDIDKKELGLIAVVSRHEEVLGDMKKLGWIIITSLVGLMILQIWNILVPR